jgi:hypothetical protein
VSRCLRIASVVATMLALSASALAGPPPGACRKLPDARDVCRISAASRAFESYVRGHLALPPAREGQLVGCSLRRRHADRFHCKLLPTGKGAPPGCVVSAIVVELKRRVYRFRSIKVAPSCPKWEGSK